MSAPISINTQINYNRLNSAWLSLYGISDKRRIEDLVDSISDRMRDFTFIFHEDHISIININKDERNNIFYDELYKIIKKDNCYFLFTTQLQYYFFNKDEFSNNEFAIVEKWLNPYYEKSLQDDIAEIECYNAKNVKRLINLTKATKKTSLIGGHILMFFSIIFLWIIKGKSISSPENIFIFFCISLSSQLLFSIILWGILYLVAFIKTSSMDSDISKVKIIFHQKELELIGLKKVRHSYIKYYDFYKIKKINSGFIFMTKKNLGYLFYEKEIHELKKGSLEKILEPFYKK